MKMPLRHPPKTTQNRPKSLPRLNFFAIKFRPRFGIDFGTILAPKMPPFGIVYGTKIGPRAAREQPRAAQERSRGIQERPRRAPDGPACPKGRPKISQTPPRTPQLTPDPSADLSKCLPRPARDPPEEAPRVSR